MTVELVPYRQPTEIQRQEDMQDAAVARLGEWARSAHAAHEIAEVICSTAFVPAQFRNEPGLATAAILAGTEVGLSPMNALRSFDIIDGTAAPRAITLRAIVQSQGHEIILVESTSTRCKMKGRRRGSKEWQPVTWTIDRAKDLGLTTRGKNPDKNQWKRQPTAMLVARATSELCRLVASDAILGIGLSYEEIADGDVVEQPAEAGTTTEEQPKTRRMSRKKAASEPKTRSQNDKVTDPRPGYSPVDDAENGAGTAPETTPEPTLTDAQSKKLHATFNDLGITERDARMAYTIDVIGRDIESSKELTKNEASQVIDRLQHDLEQPFPDEGGGDG